MRNALILFAMLAIGFILYSQERQTKLAVMEIEDKSGKLSKTILENAAEALRTELVASNKFIVISKDRQRKAMIKGQKQESWKECYDQACRIELGQALTADSILTGIVTLFGGKYTLTAELIDLAKEATVKTAKAEFDGTEVGLSEAIKDISAQITGRGAVPRKVDREKDAQACDVAKKKDAYEVWGLYLEEFPQGSCAFEAKGRVRELMPKVKPQQEPVVEKKETVGNYEIRGDVVIDENTGLMWQRERAGNSMKHAAAIEYCNDLSLGGYSDWRLPSISELKTLIVGCQSGTDACKVSDNCLSSSCYSDSCYCKGSQGPGEDGFYWQKGVWQGGGTYFWSSSVQSDSSHFAWDVNFDNGSVNSNYRYGDSYVRCDRGRP
ncbi:MAG TPA: DUF1566 domain-containing protein [bacterium]|nr:DUF1566 domain-containing protein [bacterium]